MTQSFSSSSVYMIFTFFNFFKFLVPASVSKSTVDNGGVSRGVSVALAVGVSDI